ncbi:MAG: hypothetical protein QNJ34_28685 [Xenococcaceae cyanobacterium MO_188.B29]|nr:hypothetical protein [Xenococcaceae cyanobacterium MO_188.B29]
MKWTESYKQILRETAKTLKGASRRRLMAQIVLELPEGEKAESRHQVVTMIISPRAN